MIMSISFDPCTMDYPSWLTVASLIMAVLIFFLSEFFHNFENNNSSYSSILVVGVTVLFVIITVGILCFIYNLERLGAILVTIVVIILPLYLLMIYWIRLLRHNSSQENDINELLTAYQPDIDFGEIDADQ